MNSSKSLFVYGIIAAAIVFAIVVCLSGFVAFACHFFPHMTPMEALGEVLYTLAWVIGAMICWYLFMFLHMVTENAPFWMKEYRRKRYDFKYAETRARRAAKCGK